MTNTYDSGKAKGNQMIDYKLGQEFNEVYDEGFDQGYKEGLEAGYETANDNSYDQGYMDAIDKFERSYLKGDFDVPTIIELMRHS